MHLFTRTVTMTGSLPKAMAYCADIRGYVSEKLGQDIGLWSANFGAPHGTMVFSARVEGLAHLAEMNTTLMSDETYLDKLEAGAEFRGIPGTDALARPLNADLAAGTTPPVGAVAIVTTATAANGHMTDAVEWGLEIAAHAGNVGGVPIMVLASAFGEFGQLGWLSVTPDAATAQAATDAVNADEGYLKMINDAGDLFVPGTAHRRMTTRIA